MRASANATALRVAHSLCSGDIAGVYLASLHPKRQWRITIEDVEAFIKKRSNMYK